MTLRPLLLLNSPHIEIWPAWLLCARSNADARLLSRARWALRRKQDGRYLGAMDAIGKLTPMVACLCRETGLDEALRWRSQRSFTQASATHRAIDLPMHALSTRLMALGLDADVYGQQTGLPLVAEPDWLAFAGFDRYRRPLWLRDDAARAWQRMQAAAQKDGVWLEAISGYRSHAYQLGIFERKRARGLSVEDILQVNAAPGFSEHHSGLALDIGTPGEPAAEESFEATPACDWLRAYAADHGFGMSYPRNNPHGIVYEPWHWRFNGAALG